MGVWEGEKQQVKKQVSRGEPMLLFLKKETLQQMFQVILSFFLQAFEAQNMTPLPILKILNQDSWKSC